MNDARAIRQLKTSVRNGSMSPPRNVPIWTPDCLIPVTTPREPNSVFSTMSELVAGLLHPLARPLARAANTSSP